MKTQLMAVIIIMCWLVRRITSWIVIDEHKTLVEFQLVQGNTSTWRNLYPNVPFL
jgi:hypothetical protein